MASIHRCLLIITGQVLPKPEIQPLLTYEELMAEFSHLLMAVCNILSQSPESGVNLEKCKQFCIYLKASDNPAVPLFSQDKISEIKNCGDFEKLFEIINQHLTLDKPFILNKIINICQSDEAENEFDKYNRKMAVSKALEIISSNESNPPPGFEKFCVVIDRPYTKLTVEKYEEIKAFIFDTLDVHHYVANRYIRFLFNSLHLEWHVTMQAIPHMITMAHQRQKKFQKNYYIFMQIGKEIIIHTNTGPSLVSLNIQNNL